MNVPKATELIVRNQRFKWKSNDLLKEPLTASITNTYWFQWNPAGQFTKRLFLLPLLWFHPQQADMETCNKYWGETSFFRETLAANHFDIARFLSAFTSRSCPSAVTSHSQPLLYFQALPPPAIKFFQDFCVRCHPSDQTGDNIAVLTHNESNLFRILIHAWWCKNSFCDATVWFSDAVTIFV